MFGDIRTMTDEKGETFFVGKDVAKALGYAKPLDALSKHVEEDDSAKCGLIDSMGLHFAVRPKDNRRRIAFLKA